MGIYYLTGNNLNWYRYSRRKNLFYVTYNFMLLHRLSRVVSHLFFYQLFFYMIMIFSIEIL